MIFIDAEFNGFDSRDRVVTIYLPLSRYKASLNMA